MKRFFLGIILLSGLTTAAAAQEFTSSAGMLKMVTVAQKLEHPWSLAFLPDGRMLVTERPGRLRIVTKDGKLSQPLKNVPPVYAKGQGGLLDVVLDPDFKSNQTIYFSYAEEADGKAGTAVARAVLKDNALEGVQVIFRQQPKVRGGNHWGSRLVFARDDTLFITLGERFDQRDKAQGLDTHMGKVVRLRADGSVPPDNPFVKRQDALPETWSYGHRNIQGAALHPESGQLWLHEHGPRGGDEVNIAAAGKNYGWPQASYGSHYSGATIPDEHTARGFEEPLHHWTPSVAPSGMMFYTGGRFPAWKGDLLLGALADMSLIRLDIENGKVVSEERLLKHMEERIRDVRQGPDGLIYLLTDSDNGRILRLEPAQ